MEEVITEDQAMQVLRAAYWNTIRSAAESVAEEVKNGDDLEEALDSWADSQVIYTSNALQVLVFTENDSAIEDVFGDDPSEWRSDGVHNLYTKIAYFAFREDIRRLLPEEEEEEEESESK